MAGSGLKWVHATNKGRHGVDGDLEKSRKQVRLRLEVVCLPIDCLRIVVIGERICLPAEL